MEKQIESKEYRFEKYCHLGRWISYHVQLREIFRVAPTNLLEVGTGDGVVRSYVQQKSSMSYTNVDVAEDLDPDVVASVTELPFEKGGFDLVVAFQVLEHLPFEQFDKALQELARVSKSDVLISLPHFGPRLQFFLKLPFVPEIKCAFKVPFPRKHTFDGQHYWEIGKKGYSPHKVRQHIEKYFVIEREFVPFYNQYHRFYVLKKK